MVGTVPTRNISLLPHEYCSPVPPGKWFSSCDSLVRLYLQMSLGDAAQNEDVGHLVLQHLCPALHAFLLDGLQPQVGSLLGKVRNNVWRLVLDSAQMGERPSLSDLSLLPELVLNHLPFCRFFVLGPEELDSGLEDLEVPRYSVAEIQRLHLWPS